MLLPPVTSEREIRAGPISDVPHICNNGCGGLPQLISPRRCVGVGRGVGQRPGQADPLRPGRGGPEAVIGPMLEAG